MPRKRQNSPIKQLAKRLLLAIGIVLFVAIGVWLQRADYSDARDSDPLSIIDSLYYASVSVTTTGYGDVVPATSSARVFTILIVTPARVLFLLLLVGTSVELIALASRSVMQQNKWRRRVKDHVVICGFGVKGRTAYESLREQESANDQVVVIDPSEDVVAEAARSGCVGIVGEASRDDLLRAAQIDRARVVIVAPNRDDASVLITLSVRNLNPNVRIVAAARELENVPLLRRSGADVVLPSSGSTGRMLGLAAITPHYVHVIEELLESGHGFDLVEREVESRDAGPLQTHRRERELVVAVFRNDELIERNPDGAFVLEPGDQIVSVAAPIPKQKN